MTNMKKKKTKHVCTQLTVQKSLPPHRPPNPNISMLGGKKGATKVQTAKI